MELYIYVYLIEHLQSIRDKGTKLPSVAVDLYLFLIHFAYKMGFPEQFEMATDTIVQLSNLSRPTVVSARKKLVESGLISVSNTKNQPTIFTISARKNLSGKLGFKVDSDGKISSKNDDTPIIKSIYDIYTLFSVCLNNRDERNFTTTEVTTKPQNEHAHLRQEFFERFLSDSNTMALEQLAMGTPGINSVDELKQTISYIRAQWDLSDKAHPDYQRFSQDLISYTRFIAAKDNANSKAYIKSTPIDIRRKKFYDNICDALRNPNIPDMSSDRKNAFWSYWTETDEDGIMRFEREKFWELENRLTRWAIKGLC